MSWDLSQLILSDSRAWPAYAYPLLNVVGTGYSASILIFAEPGSDQYNHLLSRLVAGHLKSAEWVLM